MISPIRILFAVLTLAGSVRSEVRLTDVFPGPGQVTLQWTGGTGPYQIETSRDLQNWSVQGDLTDGNRMTVAGYRSEAYYRVVDLDPAAAAGALFGWLQTDQGEFGELLGRHRLKSRLWLYLPRDGTYPGGVRSPATHWRKLIVHWQRVEEGVVRTWSGPLESLGTVATPGNDRVLTVSWTEGAGAGLRTFLLTLEFPYAVNTGRAVAFKASDPYYTLKCAYATPQPEFDFLGLPLGSTREDTIRLIELAPLGNDWKGIERKYSVAQGGARMSLHFLEGMPLVQGEPPWILKTFPLDRWLSPAASAGVLPPFRTDSYFAQTLLPGHHNFYAEVLVEPGLDPALSDETRSALRERNIQHIYTFKDLAGVTQGGDDAEDIRLIGFDGTVRRP